MDKAFFNPRVKQYGRGDNWRTHAQTLEVAPLGSINALDSNATFVKGTIQNLVKCPICTTNIITDCHNNAMDFLKQNMNRHSVPKLTFSDENGTSGELCETCSNEESETKCVECDQKLCFDCTKIHLKTTATRLHHITGLPFESAPLPVPKSRKHISEPLYVDTTYSTKQNGVTFSPNGNTKVSYNGKITEIPEDNRVNQVRYSDIYQRGNSPRPNLKRRQFDFKHVEPKGWGTDFSLVNTFDIGSYVLAMCPASRDQCWVSMSTGIHLYNIEGQNLKTLDVYCEVRDMTVNKVTEELYLSCFKSKTIKKVDKDGEITDFLQLPLHPAGIAINSYGDIVICGVEDLRRRYKSEHRNRILIYTREGNLKREIERDHNGKIFNYPEYVDVNINGDMCVSDIENESLIILREDGRLKSVYKGPPKGSMNNKFDPRDVKCDKEGNIIVCDINNSALHLLDVNGNFERILLSEDDGIYWPDILSIDHRNHIWVRELWQQSIKVFQALGTY